MLEIVVYLLAVANVGFGVFGLCFPRRAARFAGFDLADSSAFGEIRGVYGGLVIGLGLALAWTARAATAVKASGALTLYVPAEAVIDPRILAALMAAGTPCPVTSPM